MHLKTFTLCALISIASHAEIVSKEDLCSDIREIRNRAIFDHHLKIWVPKFEISMEILKNTRTTYFENNVSFFAMLNWIYDASSFKVRDYFPIDQRACLF